MQTCTKSESEVKNAKQTNYVIKKSMLAGETQHSARDKRIIKKIKDSSAKHSWSYALIYLKMNLTTTDFKTNENRVQKTKQFQKTSLRYKSYTKSRFHVVQSCQKKTLIPVHSISIGEKTVKQCSLGRQLQDSFRHH